MLIWQPHSSDDPFPRRHSIPSDGDRQDAGYEAWLYAQPINFTCAECGTNPVVRKGQTCLPCGLRITKGGAA